MAELDEEARRRILRRAAGAGPIAIPRADVHEWTDERNEEAVLARVKPIALRHGSQIMGIADLPTEPYRFTRHGIEWVLGPMDMSREHDVPHAVYSRWQAMKADGVRFKYYLWAEEQDPQPQLRPVADGDFRTRARPTPGWLALFTTTDPKPIDPMFIGVVATGPYRGVWCLLGEWFE